jgi:GNAT superfamily N-acetyltransferase
MDITFERALIGDADLLVQVQIASFHYDSVLYPGIEIGGPPGYDSVDVFRAKIAEDECYKILLQDRIVGGLILFARDAVNHHLDVIFIDPDYQGHGIGTQALRFMEASYPGVQVWTLDTPAWAVRNHHFYEKNGYVREYTFVADDGTPLIAYKKQIPLTFPDE